MKFVRRALLGVVVLAVGFLTLLPIGRYLLRAAWEEARILARRRPISEIIADSSTRPQVADKLRLVLAARGFAADSLDLAAKESFTAYTQLDSDTLVLVLSGAYKDRLVAHTWWFPIVGRVPYKGFFDFEAAKAAAGDLEREGLDVYLRPSPAFSTLGWFNDPLLSTSLRADTLDLANTVIHELTHNTFYAPGQAVFNESFANFVGARGSAWFFRSRGSSSSADQEDARWADEKLMARFWDALYRQVDSAFKSHPNDKAARLAVRDTIYAEARLKLVRELGPQLRTYSPRGLERVRIDNAALLARRIYLTNVDLFDAVWVREGGDLRRAFATVVRLAKSQPRDPFGALRRWLADSSVSAGAPKPPTQ
jgi:predicted aminopeptidase